MVINHFFHFASSSAAQYSAFDIRMTQEISKVETGKQQIASNSKSFNNERNTIKFSLLTKCAYMMLN